MDAIRKMATENQFEWLETKTEYREVRASKHGDELRWMINRETILNRSTGEIVTRATQRHPGICVMVPFLENGRIALMRQYRYSANEVLWELPAGTLNGKEKNARMVAVESPEECAVRELLEETGYEATRLEKVCECYAMPGSSDEVIHVFFAHELTQRQQSLDVGEVIYEIRGFSGEELTAMIANGEIRDAKTLVGLFMALSRRPDGVRIAVG
jgi:ADP-ribose pyrophosphatase